MQMYADGKDCHCTSVIKDDAKLLTNVCDYAILKSQTNVYGGAI